ncbi:MAG TPA: sugar ABC transporter permease [Thermomicrobiales bacterium]|nr:sugar ABC transporter permease [Thermomicrobiales bacterium]HRA47879.1 sugar ABC transporter permease [Thermomicrobiales bacterium]
MAATPGKSPNEPLPLIGGSSRSWWSKYRLPYLYILPAAIILAIVTLYPIIFEVYLSFTNYKLKNLRGTPPDWIWFDNYIRIFRNELPLVSFNFWRILLFNFTWTITNVFFHVVIGLAVALLLNRRRILFRKFWRAIFVIPWAMPPLVVATVWKNMFDTQFGAVNLTLKAIGLPGDIAWLTSTHAPIPFLPFLPLAYFAVLITNVWLGWPFMMVIATGALQSIPSDLYEAARIDGASRWQQTWDITLPLLRPAMVPAVMYGTILTFNQFNVIYFITAGGPLGKTEILVTQAFKLVNPSGLYGTAAAFSIIVFFILMVITLAQNKVARGLEGWSDA